MRSVNTSCGPCNQSDAAQRRTAYRVTPSPHGTELVAELIPTTAPPIPLKQSNLTISSSTEDELMKSWRQLGAVALVIVADLAADRFLHGPQHNGCCHG